MEKIDKIVNALLLSTELKAHQATKDYIAGRKDGIKACAEIFKKYFRCIEKIDLILKAKGFNPEDAPDNDEIMASLESKIKSISDNIKNLFS